MWLGLDPHTDGTAGDTGQGFVLLFFQKNRWNFFLSHSSNLGGNRGKDCGPVGLLTVRVLLERSLDPCYRPISLIALSINRYL